MTKEEIIQEICDSVTDQLEGTGLTFALVMWLPGRGDDSRAMGVVAHPSGASEVNVALATATAITAVWNN